MSVNAVLESINFQYHRFKTVNTRLFEIVLKEKETG